MNTIEDFANNLTRDLTRLVTCSQSPRDIVIHETAEAKLMDPLRNGFDPCPHVALFEAARNVPYRFRNSPRGRSRGRDDWKSEASGTERRESHQQAEQWREKHGEADDAPEIDIEELRKIAAKTEQSTAAAYNEYIGEPGQDARDWLNGIETKLADRQEDPSTRPHWNILRNYVGKLPDGAKVRDVDRKVLDYCLGNLVRNKIEGRK